MLPPIPNFSVVENTSRKRKKPERDFIEEMLQSENSQKEGDYQEKRAKKEDNDDGSISMMKPSLINDNTKHDSNKNPELYKKSGGLIVNIHQVLDKGSFDLFRQTMKKISSKSWDNPDSIINNILTSFFNATIGIVDPKSKVIPNEIPMYKERKKLSTELVKYISRDLRPRYKQIFSNFYDKYEDNYCNNQNSSSSIKQEKLKPKDIKQRIDEIAKRRAELKKLAKKDEIDKKLRKSCDNEERKEESEPFEEIKDQLQPSQDKDKVCIICYDFNNLYVSKCGHYACKGCWEEWLKRYLECPKCRTRVRRIQILPLSQEGLFKK